MNCSYGLVALSGAVLVLANSPSLSAGRHRGVNHGEVVCKDHKGADYSRGALVKVHDQVQQCNDDLAWVLGPDEAPLDPKIVGTDVCRSKSAADDGQVYGPGLFHPVGKSFERCVRGKWELVK